MNKTIFIESISDATILNDDFFKKVYGYSYTDNNFLDIVTNKFIDIGRNDAELLIAYNEWFIRWKKEDDKVMKNVAQWYQNECQKEFERMGVNFQEKVVKRWTGEQRWNQISKILNYQ